MTGREVLEEIQKMLTDIDGLGGGISGILLEAERYEALVDYLQGMLMDSGNWFRNYQVAIMAGFSKEEAAKHASRREKESYDEVRTGNGKVTIHGPRGAVTVTKA